MFVYELNVSQDQMGSCLTFAYRLLIIKSYRNDKEANLGDALPLF